MREPLPLVSIITPCLNSEKTIEQTIKSVINQTYPKIEYIIVDGESTDGTLGIVEKYKDKISKVVSEKDDGIYDAMNKGLHLSTGDLVGIINADDWYEANAVENIVAAFEENPNAHVFYGNLNMYYQDNFIKTRYPPPAHKLHTGPALPHPPIFIVGDIYRKYGFGTGYGVAEDWELLLKLYSQGYHFKYINANIADFRIWGESWVQNPLKIRLNRLKISWEYANSLYLKLQIILIFLSGLLLIPAMEMKKRIPILKAKLKQ